MSSTPLAVPIDSATATTSLIEDRMPHRWAFATRAGFRFAFCYIVLYCLFNGNAKVWETVPVLGEKVGNALAEVFLYPGQYLAQHLFHVPPPGDKIHETGSGDTAINWIAVLLMFVVSVLAAAIWSALDRRRPNYQTLSAWLRFLIRLTLGFGMVSYGLAKVFPLQMPTPSIAALSEPFGMHSPMAILWNFIGSSTPYEMICGAAELSAGLLLLFRRTALAGAMFTAFVITNVLLYNLCFDVPVKLYAGHLLLLSLFVILPDARPLFRFFWLHQPATPTGIWVPPASRAWFRRTTIALEILFGVLTVGTNLHELVPGWRTTKAARNAPCPLCGAWRIDGATVNAVAHPVFSEPDPKTKERRPFVELDISTATRASFRDDLGANSSFPLKIDTASHTLTFTRPDKSTIAFRADCRDASHLKLTPLGPEENSASTLVLTLVSPPGGYPLLHRGFHRVSEYPYQR